MDRWDARRYQSQYSFVWKYGEELFDLLDPQRGERIVDLGCGAGQLTSRIAGRGASVIGIDRSPEMIAQARENFPELDFRVCDATRFRVEAQVDAVFSNAVLHWVKDARAAIACVAGALKPGGRFVLEMGGKGNTRALLDGVCEVAGEVAMPWYYPSVAEYAALLEASGFEVRMATLFERPTEIEGERALEDWLAMFCGDLGLTAEQRAGIADRLRATMYRDGVWTIDYRRLRVSAVKL